jgi:3-oxoacyl-[acyl-carrier-protein] synthase III
LAHWIPEQVVTSAELEADLGLGQGFIERSMGVRARRAVDPDVGVVDMALKACRSLFERTPHDPEEIDFVIYVGVTRAYLEPATSTLIANALGLNRASAFDVSSACLGFIDGWLLADALLQLGRARSVLVVGAERPSTVWKAAAAQIKAGADPVNLLACFSLGDGAAAGLLTRAKPGSGRLVARAAIRRNFSEYCGLCTLVSHEHSMKTDARALFAAALEHSPSLVRELLGEIGWKPQEIGLVIPHQASMKSISMGAERMGFVLSQVMETQGHFTLERFGNLASVAVPVTLSEALEQRQRVPETALLIGYGSGLGVGVLALSRSA